MSHLTAQIFSYLELWRVLYFAHCTYNNNAVTFVMTYRIYYYCKYGDTSNSDPEG